MSAVNIPEAKCTLKPEQVTVQSLLIENGQLIETAAEYQRMGRIDEATKYQELLHKNLIYLAKLADPSYSLLFLQEIGGMTSVQNDIPVVNNETIGTAAISSQKMATGNLAMVMTPVISNNYSSSGSGAAAPQQNPQLLVSTPTAATTVPPSQQQQHAPQSAAAQVVVQQQQSPHHQQQRNNTNSATAATSVVHQSAQMHYPNNSNQQQQVVQPSTQQQSHGVTPYAGHPAQHQYQSVGSAAHPMLQHQFAHSPSQQQQFPMANTANTAAYPLSVSSQNEPIGQPTEGRQHYQQQQQHSLSFPHQALLQQHIGHPDQIAPQQPK